MVSSARARSSSPPQGSNAPDVIFARHLKQRSTDIPLHTTGQTGQKSFLPHPFAAHQVFNASVADVVSLLPGRDEADHLVAKFYRNVDPFYPVVPRQNFTDSYERFWDSSRDEKRLFDPQTLALHVAVYACGAISTSHHPTSDQGTSIEHLLSACHQALCLSSYLGEYSICSVQILILLNHALLASARTTDAWNLSGITQRQVHAIQLNRRPHVAVPEALEEDKQLRCRLWHASMLQDSILSWHLKLPPPTLYHDIRPSCLPENPQSIKNGHLDCMTTFPDPTVDVPYLRTTWELATLAQVHIGVGKAFKRPLFKTVEEKSQVISRFLDLYASAPSPYNSTDAGRFENLDPRLLRQLVFFNVHFFGALATLYLAEVDVADSSCDAMGALTAAYEGLSAFFAYARLFSNDPPIGWDSIQARAFEMAVCDFGHCNFYFTL